jgi:hypothetical protein
MGISLQALLQAFESAIKDGNFDLENPDIDPSENVVLGAANESSYCT